MKIIIMNKYLLLLLILLSFLIDLNFCEQSKEYVELVNWIIKNNGFINRKILAIETDKSNRYMITTQNITEDEIILFIPENISISITNKRISPMCKRAFRYEDDKFFYCLLLFLGTDLENKDSFFRPYYNYFVELNLSNFYLTMDNSQKELFNKTEFSDQISEINYLFNSSFMTVRQYLKISKNDFLKIYLFASSRNIGRDKSEYSDINSIVPYLDLFNHNNEPNVGYFYDDIKNGFCLYALRNINAGEELNLKYGKLNNEFLFRIYGFTLQNNIYKIPVRISFDNHFYTLYSIDYENDILNIIKSYMKYNNKLSSDECLFELKNAINKKLDSYNEIPINNNINLANIVNEIKYNLNKYIQTINNINLIQK